MEGRVEFSPKVLDRLIRDVRRTALGRHLTGNEMIDYDKLKPITKKRVDGHLAKCATCRQNFESFREVAKAWEGPEGEKRLKEFAKKMKISLRFVAKGMRPAVKQRKGSRVVIPMTQRRRT